MAKVFARVPKWIMDSHILSKVWCMGFNSGYGKSRETKGDLEYLNKVRMKNGRGGKYTTAHRRGINILATSKQSRRWIPLDTP